jgi:hypothetical protein
MKYVKYVPYALVSLLFIIGGLTWFHVITSLQESGPKSALTLKTPVVEEIPIPEEELREESPPIKSNAYQGLTAEMVKDWNIGKDGIGIDRLLFLIEDHDE